MARAGTRLDGRVASVGGGHRTIWWALGPGPAQDWPGGEAGEVTR
jgi:hypothetical protein